MLRSLWLFCLTGLLLAITSSKGHAQLHPGDLRLYMDSTFVSFNSDRVRGDIGNNDNVLSKANTTSVGLLGGGGIGLAYVVSKHIVPGIYFSIWRTKTKVSVDGDQVGDSDSNKSWELRPYLEIPFNPNSRFVVHGIAGLSILRPWRGLYTEEAIGVGPVVGLGGHGFITDHVSLDATLLFRAAFVFDDERQDQLEATGTDDPKLRQLSVMLMLGASYWL
jgi:hypothetical protein